MTQRLQDLRFEVAHTQRPFALLSPHFTQYAAARPAMLEPPNVVITTEGPSAPFAAVVVEVTDLRSTSQVVAGLASPSRSVFARFHAATGRVLIDIEHGSSSITVASRRANLKPPFTFAFVLNENAVTVLARPAGEHWRPLLRERQKVRAHLDLRDPVVLGRLRYAYGSRGTGAVMIGRVGAGYFGQVGVRDPHVVQYGDGRPYIRDRQLYFTMTSAGLGFFQQAHWGVWTLDLDDPSKVRPVSKLFFERDGRVVGDHAGQLVLDPANGRTIAVVSSWGDFGEQPVHARHLSTTEDLLDGVHVLRSEPLALPTSLEVWDPGLTRIGTRWFCTFTQAPSTGPGRFVFHPALAAGPEGTDYTDGLELIDADRRRDQTEGSLLQRVGNEWHVLASDGSARTYPVYDLRMREQGRLDAPYGTNIPHPMITPADGRWLLLTFDGTPYAQKALGYGTHGAFVVMSAT